MPAWPACVVIPRLSLRNLLIVVVIVIALIHGPVVVTSMLVALALCLALLALNPNDTRVIW